MASNDLVRSLNWTPRTILRLFLLGGGLAVLGWGVTADSALHIGIGGIAAILGTFGLWYEART